MPTDLRLYCAWRGANEILAWQTSFGAATQAGKADRRSGRRAAGPGTGNWAEPTVVYGWSTETGVVRCHGDYSYSDRDSVNHDLAQPWWFDTGNDADPPSAPSLGQRLRSLREQRGMSLASLAQEAGMTKQGLDYLEKAGKGPASVDRLAQVLGVPPGWIAFGR